MAITLKQVSILVGLLIQLLSLSQSAKILMQPYAFGMNSRLRDFIKISQILVERNHSVTVLINSDDKQAMKHIEGLEYLEFPYPENTLRAGDVELEKQLMDVTGIAILRVIQVCTDMPISVCNQIFNHPTIVSTLKNAHFDLFITDIVDPCSRIIVSMLDIPTVAYTSHGTTPDPVFYPHLMSVIPVLFSPFSDEMNFAERVGNCIGYILNYWLFIPISENAAQKLVDERGLELKRSLKDAFVDSLILVGSNFVFEYPRPLMPNIKLVGGWYVQQSKPLTGEVASFIDKPGSDGIIYISFGHMVTKTQPEKMEIISNTLKRFPKYQFVWKYNGKKIDVPSNVMQLQWAPQNDLLGHPKLRLFITHCGSHSSYETVFHGKPIVAVPLFGDQPANALRLIERLGMGVKVDFENMTELALSDAITEVLSNDTYKKNAKQVSNLHHDQQTTPVSRLIFYIEYVIRNQGIGLLASKPLKSMSFWQLYSVDIIVFFGVIIILFLFIAYMVLKYFVKFVLKLLTSNEAKDKRD